MIAPIYESQDHIPKFFEYIQKRDTAVGEIEVAFVLNGAPDDSEQIIYLEPQKYAFKIKVRRLSRNFGVIPVLQAAMRHVSTSSLVIIGADLQGVNSTTGKAMVSIS
jgi:glycosyltransferase involved in cell wall biosynthesis